MDVGANSFVWGDNDARAGDANSVAAWARSVAELVESEPGWRPVVVAIDGCGGAGKSSLAALVGPLLDDAPVVHMDDLYPGWDGLARAVPLLVEQVLAPLARGERASYRRYDWVAGGYAETLVVPVHRYVVVEGVGSSAGAARAYTDVRVWVQAPVGLRRQRGEDRDGGGFAGHWERWAAQEQALFDTDRTPDHAHLTIETGPG
ncbi:hypothetical protein [Allobranchiibius sp. CTAmp26]|uniref:hypothetical protein n=1 Tax=Allobranchiibius sp. CTAmp26 TaxID=2815214 RepID=UPI001AA17DFC|nr:hypothetical protein [Allobranchiibius sp. CTAmp26]MBO1754313.1 hypothetical protein [Allobranchiibius sp. CTAmp26]